MSNVFRLKCEHCQRGLKVSTRFAGRRTRCPDCSKPLVVPTDHQVLQTTTKSAAEPPAGRRPDNSKLGVGEWFAGAFPFVFGPIVVVYWAIRGNRKWKPLLALTASLWALILGVLYWQADTISDFFRRPQVPQQVVRVDGAVTDEVTQPRETAVKEDERQSLSELRRFHNRRQAEANFLLSPPGEQELASMDNVRQRAFRANVAIRSGLGVGSGVICRISEGTALILTNRHVVDPQFLSAEVTVQSTVASLPSVQIHYVNSDTLFGRVVWTADDGIDIALIEADCPESGIASADWESTANVSAFDEVFTVGNPVGLGWSYSHGHISAIRKRLVSGQEVPILQVDASINRGNSGGGLYNQSGQLIGINTSIINPELAQRIGFAIRMDFLRGLEPPGLKP